MGSTKCRNVLQAPAALGTEESLGCSRIPPGGAGVVVALGKGSGHGTVSRWVRAGVAGRRGTQLLGFLPAAACTSYLPSGLGGELVDPCQRQKVREMLGFDELL